MRWPVLIYEAIIQTPVPIGTAQAMSRYDSLTDMVCERLRKAQRAYTEVIEQLSLNSSRLLVLIRP